MGKRGRLIKDRVEELMRGLPLWKLPEAKDKEFLARLYHVHKERETLVDFMPFKRTAVFRAALSFALIAVFFIGFNFLFMPMYPSVSGVKGTVKIYRSDKNEWVFAKNTSMRLGKNDILKTFGDGQADLVIANLFHMRIKSDSEIKLCRSISRAFPGNIDYTLNQGRVLANYNKNRRIGKELNIQTPQAEASALGTDFMVESAPAFNKTMVGVLEGVVRVESLNIPESYAKPVLVKSGEKTIVYNGMLPSTPTRLVENEILSMEDLYGIGSKPQVALLISSGPTRTRELLVMRPLYTSIDKSSILPKKMEKIAKDIDTAIKENSKEKHLENIKDLEEIVNKHPNPKYDVQFLLFIGAYYGYIEEDSSAVKVFERIISEYPKSSMASIAQCAIGIISEEKLKDISRAIEAYKKVISNYPNSPEVEEAVSGLKRLQ